MVKFAEADTRLFKRTFVCRNCKSKIKADTMVVMAKKVSCRNCGSKALRPVRKK